MRINNEILKILPRPPEATEFEVGDYLQHESRILKIIGYNKDGYSIQYISGWNYGINNSIESYPAYDKLLSDFIKISKP